MQISDNARHIFGLFSSFQYQMLFKLSHLYINLAYYAASLDFGLLYAARRDFFTLICGLRRRFSGRCENILALALNF
jgi:hypothetical protein